MNKFNFEHLLKGGMFEEKEVSEMDNGFIESCLELGSMDIALVFLQRVYKMTVMQSIKHIRKVLY